MPKHVALFLMALSFGVALAACHGSTGVTPTPSPVPSYTPNPDDTHATVEVTIEGSPTPKIPVEISTPNPYPSGRPGTPFKTNYTNKDGYAAFSGLKYDGTYCWVALLGEGKTSSTCASWAIWQTSTITLGN